MIGEKGYWRREPILATENADRALSILSTATGYSLVCYWLLLVLVAPGHDLCHDP